MYKKRIGSYKVSSLWWSAYIQVRFISLWVTHTEVSWKQLSILLNVHWLHEWDTDAQVFVQAGRIVTKVG